MSDAELAAVAEGSEAIARLSATKVAELYAKHLLVGVGDEGMRRLLEARRAARRETVASGVSLHILVPTLQCAHSCRYCQVSRALNSQGYEMTSEQLDAACDTVFESPSLALTVEFQGGDPLIRFDLVRRAIERIALRNVAERRRVQFVVASTLHQLDEEICAFFREHRVALSTSIDGPALLHNKNRPMPGRNAYERTVFGIAMARERIGPGSVSALMTATRDSLLMPEAIVDDYVRLGFDEIFVRPLAQHGFARRNSAFLAYPAQEYFAFYERCIERILWWNRQGVPLREATAATWFNKLLSPFDAGYVDLQSPTGAGSAVLVYNYDGWVYPSDEARMLAEAGDASLRLGQIGEPMSKLLASPLVAWLREQSDGEHRPECANCAYNTFCGPDPVAERAAGQPSTVAATEHCQRSTWMFRHLLERLERAELGGDEAFLDLAHAWAHRAHPDLSARHAKTSCNSTQASSPELTPRTTTQPRLGDIPVRVINPAG